MQGPACCYGVRERKGQHVVINQDDCYVHCAQQRMLNGPIVGAMPMHDLTMALSRYLQRNDWTHGNVELCQIWGHMSEHRCLSPIPEHLKEL